MATIAELLLEQGRRAADARRRSGETTAQLIAGLAGTVGQTAQAYSQERQQAPIRAQQANQRRLEIQQAQGAIGAQQRQVADQSALDAAMGSGLDLPTIESALEQAGAGHLIPTVRKSWNEAETAAANLKTAKQKADDAERDYWGALAAGVQPHLGEADGGLSAAKLALQHAKQNGYADADSYLTQIDSPEKLKATIDGLISASPTYSKLAGEAQDRTLRQTQEARALQTATQAAADREADNRRADAQAAETARHNQAMEKRPVAGAGTNVSDVAETVRGMKDGTLPPILPGRATKDYVNLLAEAHRQGYDLSQAATDWAATQKHIATLNNSQQTRLNQSINALPELLDSVDTLASQWKGGKFPPLNRANLALAKNGAYGQDVASVARQLDSQIADVVADLGNVYMGGNSPTDHALALAGKSLQSDWSEKVLHDMVKLAKGNVSIRRNSIANTGVQGASANNPYAAPSPSNAADPLGILGGAR